jgi:hypothetical protein
MVLTPWGSENSWMPLRTPTSAHIHAIACLTPEENGKGKKGEEVKKERLGVEFP